MEGLLLPVPPSWWLELRVLSRRRLELSWCCVCAKDAAVFKNSQVLSSRLCDFLTLEIKMRQWPGGVPDIVPAATPLGMVTVGWYG